MPDCMLDSASELEVIRGCTALACDYIQLKLIESVYPYRKVGRATHNPKGRTCFGSSMS